MSEMTVAKGAVVQEAERLRAMETNCRVAAEYLEAIGDLAEIDWAHGSSYCKGAIEMRPAEGSSARQAALAVIAKLKALGLAPSKADKKFDAFTGKVTFSVPIKDTGAKIEITGGDPKCKVKAVTSERYVPGYVTTTTKYEIENPEECGAASE